jgi:SAM-dependent methyltransferase
VQVPTPVDIRQVWEERYRVPKVGTPGDDDWLARWQESVDAAWGQRGLDIGCGPGGDTVRLQAHGLPVVSLDFSFEALRRVQALRAETAGPATSVAASMLVQSDLSDGLPFHARSFGLITASLVLHYFNQQTTQRILSGLRDGLIPGGRILMRLNSTDDIQFGAQGNSEIEPGVHLVGGVAKRFYGRNEVMGLFDAGWRVVEATQQASDRYSRTKQLWEVCAERVSVAEAGDP